MTLARVLCDRATRALQRDSLPLHCRTLLSITFAAALLWSAPVSAQRLERIGSSELDSYMRWLELDDEQKAVARELHRDYIETWEEELLPRAQAVWRQGGGDNPTSSRRIWNEWEDVLAAALERDEAFFTSLEQVLRPEQAPRMQRVRLGRARHLWRHGTTEFPEANVDLIALVEELDLDEEAQAAVDEVIVEFEPVFVKALKNARDLSKEYRKRRLTADMLAASSALEAGRIDDDPETPTAAIEEEYYESKEEYGSIVLPGYQQLVQINRNGLGRFASSLSEDQGETLRKRYREVAYPRIYPDPVDGSILYDSAEQLDDLTASQQNAVEAARKTFRVAHEGLSRRMSELQLASRKTWTKSTRESIQESGRQEQEFNELALEREALNAKQALILRGILSPEQFALLPEWDFEKNPPPRPWDPHDTLRRRERLMQERAERIEEMRKQAEERQQGDG